MCWSRSEREEWLRAEREREQDRLREISPSEPEVEEPAVAGEVEEREGELIRI
jgi:hypothetical protein